MSQSTRFNALVVEEKANNTFTKSICQRDVTDLPDNELLIEVHYSSLNFKDAMSASGNKRITQHYPHTRYWYLVMI
jgi:acrylyl-CoA reductase (NADPH)